MEAPPPQRSFVAPYIKSVPRSGIRDFFEIVSTRKDIISLGIGEPDFVSPWHICEASVYALEHGATCYTSNLGTLELRHGICEYLKKYELNYSPKTETLITVGVSEALDLAVRAIVQPGDEIIYHEPSFVAYAPIITFAHGVPVPVTTTRENHFHLTRASLEKVVTQRTRALLINFPTNPTGAIMREDELREIAEFAIEHDILVISDEIYAELTFGEQHISIAKFPGMKERTILLNGFSKAWAMTGFRIGYACAPADLIEAMMKIHQYTMMCAPILSQKAAEEALRGGDIHVNRMVKEYEKRRNFICASFNAIGIPCHPPEGAFYAWPYIGEFGLTSMEFSLRLIEEESVACVPGTAFGASGEGFMRCAFATGLDQIKEAVTRIGRFVKKL
ncbi:MAG: aminotransferase class I/II-fold pyridoxal phosphate-dependent enzyme [Verrucomicrobia bacterium]|nr:aminotransferase class I/II-fold pyridoxal phosphate-dependent enzyme [Verrucomicrobiota bacterium]